MAQTLETLTRRTNSMQGIRSVVHTMKTLSVINAAPYEHAARSIRAYHDTVLQGMHAFFSQIGTFDTFPDATAKQILVVFGSDHGLCGNYNESLAAHVLQGAAQGVDGQSTVLCIGALMADALADLGVEVEQTFIPPASVDGIGRLSNLLTQTLADIRHHHHPREISVTLAYVARLDGGLQAPKIAPLLPIDPALIDELRSKPWGSRSLPMFSMQADALYSTLLREHLFATIFRASAEALLTENAARLALMQQAEQSVDDRLDVLKSDTRAMRQTEITTELLDVIIGFEALKKKEA